MQLINQEDCCTMVTGGRQDKTSGRVCDFKIAFIFLFGNFPSLALCTLVTLTFDLPTVQVCCK